MTFDPLLTPAAFEDDDFEYWRKTGQLLDTEDDFAFERELYEDRQAAHAPATRLPILGGFKHV